MIQRTADRLAPLAKADRVWVITNDLLAATISAQLEGILPEQVICEPVARNTAPAAGLAAFLIERTAPEAVLGMFPADHTIGDEAEFLRVIQRAAAIAAGGQNIVVLGVTPTRAETGYGYIETGDAAENGAVRVRRFTEKPDRERAQQFLAARNYCWNSGVFVWSARTLANAVREHMPETAPYLERIAKAWGTANFKRVFADLYPLCKNISVDYAVLEPRSAKGEHLSNLYCLPADFGWNDLGSWAALYEHKLKGQSDCDSHGNVVEAAGALAMNASGNYVYSPKTFVALVGVRDLVVVETEDALLITTRERSQDVGTIVKDLAAEGRKDLI